MSEYVVSDSLKCFSSWEGITNYIFHVLFHFNIVIYHRTLSKCNFALFIAAKEVGELNLIST